MKKVTKQPTAMDKEERKRLGNPRLDQRGFENQALTIPADQKGYETVKDPGPDPRNTGPAVPPLSQGKNWNATRPKAPQAAK
jgi:hypothetical protein